MTLGILTGAWPDGVAVVHL